MEVIRSEKPTHLAVVFDPPGPTLRTEQFEAYKANRDETPEDIKLSVPWIVRILEACGFPCFKRRDMRLTTDRMFGQARERTV